MIDWSDIDSVVGRNWFRLDPDLTEEAGYSGWDPPDRSYWIVVQRLLLLATLLSIVGGALLVLTR